jgi:RNA recognition motif-containing protein
MSKLYVGNLPFNVDDVSLGEWVASAGFRVQSARVIIDRQTQRSRGFGFVELVEGEDLAKAIETLNGSNLGGRTVQVNEARPERPRAGGDRRGGRGGYGGGRQRW